MSMTRTKGLVTTLALMLVIPLAACESSTDAEFGTLSIQLTDATSEHVTEAWVTITDIYLQRHDDEGEDPEDSRVYLLQDADETHELLSLANKVEELVGGEMVPIGTYGQLRVVISDGCIVVGEGETATVYSSSAGYDLCGPSDGTLQMPSYAETGVKLLLRGFEVTSGHHGLLLDFDVSQSFGRQAGLSGMWVMHPVIHWSEISLSAAAEVTLSAGEVELPEGFELGQFSATILPTEGDEATVAFTDDNEDGIYEAGFYFLIPDNGPFDIQLDAPDGLSVDVDPDSPVTVDPASGETATVDWVLESATAEGGS